MTPQPQKMHLDELDERIVWELLRDAGQSNKALAERLGVSESTTINRVRALRAAGVVGKAHVTIDVEALGFNVQALVFVRLRPQARPRIKEFAEMAARIPQTINVFFMGGNDDFVIHVFCTSTGQLRDLVSTRLSMDPAVATTSTQVVFDYIPGVTRMEHVSGWDEIRAPIPA
ncbi:Lrp/AsnC family transcriptional regulator [Microbacterium sp.]|uniref:Lrp/AsnC family transcriptional regulator n=1 Tax=Microbacterium sp. TaxID=51671 RepID=UPI003C7730FD